MALDIAIIIVQHFILAVSISILS